MELVINAEQGMELTLDAEQGMEVAFDVELIIKAARARWPLRGRKEELPA
jgi:hypothetical protein